VHDTSRSRFTVHYRFHPLHGREVEAVSLPRHADGAVTVEDRPGCRLKIPLWMLSPAASRLSLDEQPCIRPRVLLELAELLRELLGNGEPSAADDYVLGVNYFCAAQK